MRPCYLNIPHTPNTVVPSVLQEYYGPDNVLVETTNDIQDFLLDEPEYFNRYEALVVPYRRDFFRDFDPKEFNFFSVVCNPAVRAWNEYRSQQRLVTFEHWLKHDSIPNLICYHLTGLKTAGIADIQTLVRLANFWLCTIEQLPDMMNALGRFHGWSQFKLVEPLQTPLETQVMPPRTHELVQTYHRPDVAVYQWLQTRRYQF